MRSWWRRGACSDDVLGVVFSKLGAADLCRCACVSRGWRCLAEQFAKPSQWVVEMEPAKEGDEFDYGEEQPVDVEGVEEERLWMYDLEEDRERWVRIRIQPEWGCEPTCKDSREMLGTWPGKVLRSYQGLLLVRLSYRSGYELLLGNPLKNRWAKIPTDEVLFFIDFAAISPAPNPLLLVSGWNSCAAVYSFDKQQWIYGKSEDETDDEIIYGYIVWGGDAFYACRTTSRTDCCCELVRLDPHKEKLRWEVVEWWKTRDLLPPQPSWLYPVEELGKRDHPCPERVYAEAWRVNALPEDVHKAHGLFEVGGRRLSWFDEEVHSKFCQSLRAEYGEAWMKHLWQGSVFMANQDVLFWDVRPDNDGDEGLVKVLVFYLREKRWKDLTFDRDYIFTKASHVKSLGMSYFEGRDTSQSSTLLDCCLVSGERKR